MFDIPQLNEPCRAWAGLAQPMTDFQISPNSTAASVLFDMPMKIYGFGISLFDSILDYKVCFYRHTLTVTTSILSASSLCQNRYRLLSLHGPITDSDFRQLNSSVSLYFMFSLKTRLFYQRKVESPADDMNVLSVLSVVQTYRTIGSRRIIPMIRKI